MKKQKFKFKDSRQGEGIYYVLKIYKSYSNVTVIEYSKDSDCTWGGGLIFAQQVELIND